MINLWAALLNLLFPARCPLCRAYQKQPGDWCYECLQKVFCPARLPISAPMQGLITEAWALTLYHGGTERLIKRLKYRKQQQQLPYIWRLLAEVDAKSELRHMITSCDLAIPVPLDKKRKQARGFNQTELIFAKWLTEHNLVMQDCLARIRPTVPMYKLNASERAQNLKNAFSLKTDVAIHGKKVLLLDDIMTTGATIYSCAKVLQQAGVKSVAVLVLASDHR